MILGVLSPLLRTEFSVWTRPAQNTSGTAEEQQQNTERTVKPANPDTSYTTDKTRTMVGFVNNTEATGGVNI